MGRVLTIGVFDGVHRGHQALIGETVARAERAGVPAAAVTFDPNPLEILRPDVAPTRLCTLQRRIELLHELGLDGVEVLRFNANMAKMSADVFARQVLVERLGGQEIVIGANFRFGHKAAGDAATLRDAGLPVFEYELLEGADEPISSSRIRSAVAQGHVELASALLGHRHSVAGKVVEGRRRGRRLGYPTANLSVDPLAAIPSDGVYAGEVFWEDGQRIAAISVGTNPTFDDVHQRSVEAFLIDFDGDLYGRELRVEFGHFLRAMEPFATVEDLVAQMSHDVQQTMQLIALGFPAEPSD